MLFHTNFIFTIEVNRAVFFVQANVEKIERILKTTENLKTVGTASTRHGQKLVKALDDRSHKMILKVRIGKTLKTSENS